jgi:hypothetical protein
MAGSGNTGDGGDVVGAGRNLADDVKLRIIWALIAVIAGGGGAAGFMNMNPPRPDPFTGTEGRGLEVRIQRLELQQSKDDDHRKEAVDGYARVRQLERKMDVVTEQSRRLQIELDSCCSHGRLFNNGVMK